MLSSTCKPRRKRLCCRSDAEAPAPTPAPEVRRVPSGKLPETLPPVAEPAAAPPTRQGGRACGRTNSRSRSERVMLQPKRVNSEASSRPPPRPGERRQRVSFGEIGLQATSANGSTAARLRPARRAINHHSSVAARSGSGFSRHARDQEAGRGAHGSGKGPVDRWVAVVKPGRMMFEIAASTGLSARHCASLRHKLPVSKTRSREGSRDGLMRRRRTTSSPTSRRSTIAARA